MGRRKTRPVVTEDDLLKAAASLGCGPFRMPPPPTPATDEGSPDADDGEPGYYTIRPWTEKMAVDSGSEGDYIDEHAQGKQEQDIAL